MKDEAMDRIAFTHGASRPLPMTGTASPKGAFRLLPLAGALLLLACGSADAPDAPAEGSVSGEAAVEAQLQAVRAATERFRDVEVALEEGYIRDPMNMCETAESMGRPAEEGAMGIHYFRPDLLQITATEPRIDGMGTHTDFLNPAVLLYEPQADGSLELIGVENVAFKAAWDAAGNMQPPSFLGQRYDYMENDPSSDFDEAHMFEPHYDLHVWVFRENQAGVFKPFNPDVTCDHHDSAGHGQ